MQRGAAMVMSKMIPTGTTVAADATLLFVDVS